MPRFCLRLFPLLCLAATAFLVGSGCDEEAPTVAIAEVDYDCGRPTVTATVDRDDETITNVVVNWGRNHLAMDPPSLYASDDLGPAFGASGDWQIRAASGADVNLPAAEDLDLFLRFDFATPLGSSEKLVMNLQVQYERAGESTQSVFSERVTVPYDSTATGCGPTGGGVGPPPVGGGSATCPDTTAIDGGLAVPVVDPLFLDGPVGGETCAGSVVNTVASVPFKWQEVEGHASTNKAYQVEIRRAGQPSCLGDWTAGTSAHWSGSKETCIVFDFYTHGTSAELLQNEAYEWRVRASCTQPDGTLASGPLTPFAAFETVGMPEKLTMRSPADGASIPTPFDNTTSISVDFEWLPADCGPAAYHLRIIEAYEAPEDDDDPFNLPGAVTSDGPGQLFTVDGEERVRMTSPPLDAGREFVWWVFADTPQGRTPVLSTQDLRTFSIEE